MPVGDRYTAWTEERPAADGARCMAYALDASRCYVPYFYNPALHPDGRRLLFMSDAAGSEQAFLLDRRTRTAVQLTDGRASGQTWAPYIREAVTGIRPQFVCWSRPDWEHVLFWEGNELRCVHVDTLVDETLFVLPTHRVPCPLHCSLSGLVCFGYLPSAMQEAMRACDVEDVEDELQSGCGFYVLDAGGRRIAAEIRTPFWPNHVAASADGRFVLHCHEGSWKRQRMFVHDLATGATRPLRPQNDGAAVGHEFWMDSRRVGYHGESAERPVFGIADVETGQWSEFPSAHTEGWAAHCHASPVGRQIVTDGEATPDCISVAELDEPPLHYRAVCGHNWARTLDQRYHPHPHWHVSGEITFTACTSEEASMRRSCVCILEVAELRPEARGAGLAL